MDSTPGTYRTSDFDYHLPPELIAQYPTPQPGESRLLRVERGGGFADLAFAEFPALVAPEDVLVVNTTRVRHARLLGRRPSGAPVEVLLLHPDRDNTWIAMGKPGSALQPGKRVMLDDEVALETVEVLETGYRRVRILGATAEAAMARLGRLPLPPYIDREPEILDESRYQTVFAERESSVAAPTAGLHFTPELLAALRIQGATIAGLELEVGPGTFKPVDDEEYQRHPMHAERYHIPDPTVEAIADARRRGGAVWAIGTTAVRALESAGVSGELEAGPGETRLMITPGYQFQVVDRLLTNFHLPRSTLLMLVAGFAGFERTRAAYRHAIAAGYRFYSYGDAMAIL